jgi:hypothetical protein
MVQNIVNFKKEKNILVQSLHAVYSILASQDLVHAAGGALLSSLLIAYG